MRQLLLVLSNVNDLAPQIKKQRRFYMDNKKDLEYSVSRNFQFKNNFSKNSLEHIAYKNLVSGESTVANRYNRQEWIQSVLINCKDSISEILDIKRTGRNEEGQELSQNAQTIEIEQLKLRVLHELGWKYNGSFLRGAEETYTDAHGVTHERGDSYPELSFFITSKKEGDNYWYAASYGIMKSVESTDYGTYSYFATLDEALEFINDELLIVGRNALFKKLMQEAVRAKVREDNVKTVNDGIYKKYVTKLRSNVEKKINSIISEQVIEEKFHNVRRSTDIFILPDLIEMFLLPISDSYLSVAKQDEFRAKKAQEITDTVAVDLDEDDDVHESDSSEVALKTPEETLRDIEYDAMRKKQAEDPHTLEDNTQVKDFEPHQSHGENLFSSTSSAVPLVPVSNKENLDNKPTHSPDGEKKESQGLFTSREKSPVASEENNNEENNSLSSMVKVNNGVHDSLPQKNITEKNASISLGNTSNIDDKFEDVINAPKNIATVSVIDNNNEEETVRNITENKASVSLSEDVEDTFEALEPNEVSVASVAILGGIASAVEDSFVDIPRSEDVKIDSLVDIPDTFKDDWDEETINVGGNIEDTMQSGSRNFDDIEVDVAQETWNSIDRDISDFFDADRLPVRTENAELAEDLDSFL